jgi:hypothetical protein
LEYGKSGLEDCEPPAPAVEVEVQPAMAAMTSVDARIRTTNVFMYGLLW